MIKRFFQYSFFENKVKYWKLLNFLYYLYLEYFSKKKIFKSRSISNFIVHGYFLSKRN